MKEQKLFGLRVKEIRTKRNLSQEKLSEKADLNTKYMSRIETGAQFPSFTVMRKLADVLEVEVRDFFEFEHFGKNTRELKKTINDLLKVSNDDQLRLIVKFLRTLIR